MTREAFIRKWLTNPKKQYNKQCRDEMLYDLDLVIKSEMPKPNVCGSIMIYELEEIYFKTILDWIGWDEEKQGEYPIGHRTFKFYHEFINYHKSKQQTITEKKLDKQTINKQ